jgi:isopentenyl-diphosphate delta-isomerase
MTTENLPSDNQEDMLILVDSSDNEIGFLSKSECHMGAGQLHRAFSVFIFNSSGEVLIQKRSPQKELWGLHWSNSCCSHPRKNENIESAVNRRLAEELTIQCPIHFLYKFTYQENFGNVGSEHELCYVYVGLFDGEIKADPNEVAEYKFLSPQKLDREIKTSSENFTPWMQMEWNTILDSYTSDIENKMALSL